MSDAQDETPADLTVRRLRWVMALCTGLLVAATWPLWLPESSLPQIPWTNWAARLPRGPGEIAMVANLAVFLLLQFLNIRRTWLRRGLNAYFFLTSVPLLLLLDQHRLQPWAWQMLLGAGIIALSRSSLTALACLRWLTISIYVWSAISKFDWAFLAGHGQVLLDGLADAVGLSTAMWSQTLRQTLAAAMPVGELTIAVLLAIPRSRRIGLWGLIAMHAALILALGPTGLGHEWGVLIWNAFFIAGGWLLFRPPEHLSGTASGGVTGGRVSSEANGPAGGERCATGSAQQSLLNPAVVFTCLATLLPTLSLVGWWDWWPSWAVYSSRPAIVQMLVHEQDVEHLPASLQPHVGPALPLSDWRPVNLDGWSYAVCWCPMYPQQRYRLAVIVALAEQADIEPQVEIRSSPDRWTGQRSEQRLSADEVAQRLQTDWCNTSARRR